MTHPAILCIGALHQDIIGTAALPPGAGDDVPGVVRRGAGGVAFNLARALALALPGSRPALRAAVGDDAEGAALIADCVAAGLATAWVLRMPGVATDCYVAIEGPGGLVAAVCDARALAAAEALLPEVLENGAIAGPGAPFGGVVVADGNLSPETLARIAANPALAGADLRLASAAPAKAAHLRAALGHPRTTLYLNLAEARALLGDGAGAGDSRTAAAALVGLGAARALVTDGAGPVALACRAGPRHVAHPPRVTPACITGAGDALMAAHIAAELRGLGADAALAMALRAAASHIAAPPAAKATTPAEQDPA
jgi:sugar/nucleoside kinase (ribokinase family)